MEADPTFAEAPLEILTTADGDSWQPVRDVLAAVDVEAVANDVVGDVKALSGYEEIPESDLLENMTANVAFAIAVLGQRRILTADEVAVVTVTAGLRASQGIPVDSILHGYDIVAFRTWQAMRASSGWNDLEADQRVELAELTWRTVVTLMPAIARAHQATQIALVRDEHERRSAFVRSVLLGGTPDPQGLAGLQLSSTSGLHVFRARPSDPSQLRRLEFQLLSSGGAERVALICTIEGDLAGILVDAPDLGALDAVVAVAQAEGMHQVSGAFRVACRVLETASAYGMRGVLGLADVGLRAAVADDPDLGTIFARRFLAPLREEGAFGEVLEDTIRVHLDNGMNVEVTARELHVHPNTVRYRLARYEELTGVRLDATEQVLELWWALESARTSRK